MLKTRQRLGKYRIDRRLGQGGFAIVYQAYDTVEGTWVALKVPHPYLMTPVALEDFRKEVRLTANLDHPNVLPIKNAAFIGEYFVIVYPLGERTLADRMGSRISLRTALEFAEQMLDALAYAHQRRIIHCDIKPENFILFADGRLRLTDFGIAKVALRTITASGSGTVGYVAPEQALGKPSLRSDLFSLGLILCRMLSGRLPEWPFDWPPPGFEKLRRKLHPDLIALLRRALEVDQRKRFVDAVQMRAAFGRLKKRALNFNTERSRRGASRAVRDWKLVRLREFQRRCGRALQARFACGRCRGPVAETMQACPWCGTKRRTHRGETRFPRRCPRCRRGLKLDWRFCPWCYGAGVGPASDREYGDKRYDGRCASPTCTRRTLMPFMRYCPWCRQKVRRRWKVTGAKDRCPGCGWGIVRDFWDYCPWCARPVRKRL